MKALLTTAAFGAGLLAAAPGAFAAEYAVIKLDTTVNAPIDKVWSKVGGYCQIQDWLKQLAPCVLSGDGGLGSVRKLGAQGITEVMVAQTRYSYTYAQPTEPGLGILYHGTLSAEPIDKGHTKLMYSVVWDIAPDGTQDKKDADRKRRSDGFTTALANMKAIAEAK
jgi:hypothetical protein